MAKKKSDPNTRDVKIMAIVGVTAITIVGYVMGYDGALAASLAGIIGGIAGYTVKVKK